MLGTRLVATTRRTTIPDETKKLVTTSHLTGGGTPEVDSCPKPHREYILRGPVKQVEVEVIL